MAELAPVDPFAFEPFDGGMGVSLDCTDTTASAQVPGTQANDNSRVLVTNIGAVTVFVRFGGDGVTATLNCQAILPGTTQPFSAPRRPPSGLYVAGICASGETTTIQVTAGRGV